MEADKERNPVLQFVAFIYFQQHEIRGVKIISFFEKSYKSILTWLVMSSTVTFQVSPNNKSDKEM